MKKLLLIPILVLFLLSFVNADVSRTFYFKDANGNNLENVNYVIYTCLDASCSSVKIPDFTNGRNSGNSNNYPPNNDGEIVFPTNLETSYGYALYFYKEGYLPMEYFDDDRGNGYTQSTITFQKKAQCSAPIDHIEVLNDVRPNIPLVIDVSSSLDADTYSAFHSNSNTPAFIPAEYKDFYSADTKVTLTIYKKTDLTNIVYTDSKVFNIFMDSSQSIEFTWTPTIEDDYVARITTEVIDNKCSSSKTQTATAQFKVHENVPADKCYTIVNRPGTSNPIDAEVGEEITITGVKESYYIDNYQNTERVNDIVTIKIYNSSGLTVFEQSTQNSKQNSFSFTWTPQEQGDYTIEISGMPDDPTCNGKENIPSQILTIPLTVYGKTTPTEPTLELSFIPNQVVNEGETLTFDIPYNYNGGQELTFSAENLPNGAALEPIYAGGYIIGQRFTWTPDHNTVIHNIAQLVDIFLTERDIGKAIQKIECRKDGKCEFNPIFKVSAGNLNDQQEIILSVRDVNQIPHLNYLLGPYILTEGDLLQVKPLDSFTDLDKDHLTYTYTTPLNENGEWQTRVGDAETYYSTITASDGTNQAQQEIKIVVRPMPISENHAPVFSSIADKTVYVNDLLTFTVEATDEDNDPLTYSLSVIPTGATFNTETREFSWTPTKAGDYGVGIIVKDTKDAQGFLLVMIKVIEQPEGEAHLSLNDIPSHEIKLGQTLSFEVSAQYDGDKSLSFSVENLPQGATFDNQLFTWTPNSIGAYNIVFKVTDGILESKKTAVITVTEEAMAIRATKHDIGIGRVIVNNMKNVVPGESFPVTVFAENFAGLKEKDVRVTISLPELNQIQYSSSFDLNPKEVKTQTFMFKLPVNTDKKQEVIAVTISNNKDTETKYFFIDLE